MGAISGKNTGSGVYPTIAWGKVTKDVKIGQTSKGDPKVSFSMLIIKTKKEEDESAGNPFMNVCCYGDNFNTRTASTLEAGDVVIVFGDYSSRSYLAKDGSSKQWAEIAVYEKTGMILCQDMLRQITQLAGDHVPDMQKPAYKVADKPVNVQFSDSDDSEEDLPF